MTVKQQNILRKNKAEIAKRGMHFSGNEKKLIVTIRTGELKKVIYCK